MDVCGRPNTRPVAATPTVLDATSYLDKDVSILLLAIVVLRDHWEFLRFMVSQMSKDISR